MILQPTKKEKWTMGIAIVSLCLFIIVEVINIYRFELFGIIPGYAPYNFAFNLSFFIPANLIIFFLSFGMFGRTLKNWSNWKSMKRKIIIFILTIPIISLWIFEIARIVFTD